MLPDQRKWLPDPKEMFDSTDEENRRAFNEGRTAAKEAGILSHLQNDLDDAIGGFMPDNRKSKYKSSDAGWRVGANENIGKSRKKKSTSDNHERSYSNENDLVGRFVSYIIGLLLLLFFAFATWLYVDREGSERFWFGNEFADRNKPKITTVKQMQPQDTKKEQKVMSNKRVSNKEVSPRALHTKRRGLSIDAYCKKAYGKKAYQSWETEDAFSWRCSVPADNQYVSARLLDIDMDEACRMQHGSKYKSVYENRRDEESWHCVPK